MPELIKYNPKDPPQIFSCGSGMPNEHTPECDESCESHPMTEIEVELFNEIILADREGIILQGIPTSLVGVGGRGGALVELLELDIRVTAIIDYLKSEGPEAIQALQYHYSRVKLKKIKDLREAKKRHEIQQRLGLPPQGAIFGPDGNSRLN